MVKAVDFWEVLCNDIGYRLFTGVPCEGFNSLYNKMSSSFLHYIPAANEQIAIGIITGAFLVETKAAAFMSTARVEKLDLSFNIQNDIPTFIIVSGKEKPKVPGAYVTILNEDLKGSLIRVVKHITTTGKVGILFIGEGFI